jgi:hypothetical protein
MCNIVIPASNMQFIVKSSDRPSKPRLFEEEAFSDYARHQLDIHIAWSPCHLPCQQVISKLTPIEWLWVVLRTLEVFQFDSVADARHLELKGGGGESIGVGKHTS